MHGQDRRLERITLVMTLLAISGLVYNMLAFQVHGEALFLGSGEMILAGWAALGAFALVLLFTVISFLWLLTRQRREPSPAQLAALLIAAFCLLLFVVEKVMIDEIGRELRLGWDPQGETYLLYGAMILQLAYGLMILARLLREQRQRERAIANANRPLGLQDENVFVVAQVMGILSGSIGLWMNYGFITRRMHADDPLFLLPFFAMALLPFALAICYWLLTQVGKRIADWYDEKQWRDVSRAGLATVILTVPGMACLLLVSEPLHTLWFPHYIFLTMLLFSTGTWFFFRHAA